jgi:hypothetical protein
MMRRTVLLSPALRSAEGEVMGISVLGIGLGKPIGLLMESLNLSDLVERQMHPISPCIQKFLVPFAVLE